MKEYFEYGGYHFSGYRNFNHKEKKAGVWSGIIADKIVPNNYEYNDFYKAIKGTEHYVDLFYCKEQAGLFTPTNNGLHGYIAR